MVEVDMALSDLLYDLPFTIIGVFLYPYCRGSCVFVIFNLSSLPLTTTYTALDDNWVALVLIYMVFLNPYCRGEFCMCSLTSLPLSPPLTTI